VAGNGQAGVAGKAGLVTARRGEAGHGRRGEAWSGESGHGMARQAWEQTKDDHETSFVIMNKRPPKTTAHEATPSVRCFL